MLLPLPLLLLHAIRYLAKRHKRRAEREKQDNEESNRALEGAWDDQQLRYGDKVTEQDGVSNNATG